MQGSEWLVPQVALLHTWAGEDQCRVKPLQRYYLSHTHWALIIIIIIIIILIIIIISFMQVIYSYIPETNYFPREYSVAAIIIIIIIITIIIIIIISFMQGIYTYIPETNYVPRE